MEKLYIYNKIQVLKTLYAKINNGENENPLRDFIAQHPWILSPQYETFIIEKSLKNIIIQYFDQKPNEAEITDAKEHFRKRVDLILRNKISDELVIIEFMKPSEKLDRDHITRTELYTDIVEEYCSITTPEHRKFSLKAAFIIANGLAGTLASFAKKKSANTPPLYILDWATLLLNSKMSFEEYFCLLTDQAPEDFRIKSMKNNFKKP